MFLRSSHLDQILWLRLYSDKAKRLHKIFKDRCYLKHFPILFACISPTQIVYCCTVATISYASLLYSMLLEAVPVTILRRGNNSTNQNISSNPAIVAAVFLMDSFSLKCYVLPSYSDWLLGSVWRLCHQRTGRLPVWGHKWHAYLTGWEPLCHRYSLLSFVFCCR